MADTCFRCHGPDKSSRMAGMRLDIREEALKPNARGVTPIAPGDPSKSAIVQRIFESDPARLMPPLSAHKTLTPAQRETVKRWVAEGAKYEGHWAYEPVRRRANGSIDAFIREKLRAAGLSPSPEADRATLLRRLSLDLTGIPPTPAEIEAFTGDRSPSAYEKQVDRLIASQRYAEKQAMHWLDGVRYADTAGFHGDNPFPAWPYRDYVLRSLHANQPFDQFTREQLAGDLLPNSKPEQRAASAYNRILRVSAEGGLQPKEYLAKYGADRVRTTTTVWLGSTLGCAECHDHKFDPFTARDFYSMKAFFADIKETGLVPDRGANAWGAQMELTTPAQTAQRNRLKAAADALHASLEKRAGPSEETLVSAHARGELAWQYQRPESAKAAKAALKIYNDEPAPADVDIGATLISDRKPGDGLIIASGENPETETYTVTLRPGAGHWLQLGVQAIQDESLPGLRVARGSDRLMISEVEAVLMPGNKKLAFVAAASNIRTQALDQNPMNAIDGRTETGWGGSPYGDSLHPFLALRFAAPVATTADSRIVVRVVHATAYRRATVGRMRMALSKGPAMPISDTPGKRQVQDTSGVPSTVLAAIKKEKRTDEEAAAILETLQWTDTAATADLAAWKRARAELDGFEQTVPRVMVTEATAPEQTRLLSRGNFMDESGPIVDPAIPGFLGKLPVSGRATRLDLANWLVAKENPLTARAYVNRQWRLYFGAGLSRVMEDLGSQGEWPSHPELLDWLAAEFMDSGWNRKHVTKLIVMSETYRQTSQGSVSERDPDNRLLARQNRFRVEAEVVRDVLLSVSGLLEERFGGPSVRPYQPEGYLAALNYPKREYSASRGADQYRRGLYTFWQRTFLHPSMMTFDAPSREECTLNRSNSNTPLQALVLLNDPSFVEASRVFAQNAVRAARPVEQRVSWAFRQATGRAPTAGESRILLDLYRTNLRRYDSDPAAARALAAAGEAERTQNVAPAELAATITVTRAILNLHETITRN